MRKLGRRTSRFVFSKFQFDEQEKHFEAQRRIDRLRELAEYERLVAEDNASRPRFAIGSAFSRTDRANIELKNAGGGDALGVEIVSPVGSSPRIKQDIVRAGQLPVLFRPDSNGNSTRDLYLYFPGRLALGSEASVPKWFNRGRSIDITTLREILN